MTERRQRTLEPRSPFGHLVLAARVERRLSLRALADQVGMVVGHLSDVERGRRMPSRVLIGDLCRVLAVPEGERDPWYAAAGLLGDGMLDALLARPERWAEVRRVLGAGDVTTTPAGAGEGTG